jgi:hypothetical protein
MNTVAIILAIVVVLLFYILYKYFMLKSTELSKSASLSATNPAIPITNSPSSLRYAYGIWIYVNSWNTGVSKTIFSRTNNIKLYLDSTAPVLKCDITMNGGAAIKTLEITDNFPLQKWAHVVVSVDNQYVDAYLDGKLIKSGRMIDGQNGPATPTSKDMIIGGGTTFDAYVSKFQHWAEPIDPQIVWNEYMSGNGQSRVTNFISSYGIDLSIIKDNIEQSKYSIL